MICHTQNTGIVRRAEGHVERRVIGCRVASREIDSVGRMSTAMSSTSRNSRVVRSRCSKKRAASSGRTPQPCGKRSGRSVKKTPVSARALQNNAWLSEVMAFVGSGLPLALRSQHSNASQFDKVQIEQNGTRGYQPGCRTAEDQVLWVSPLPAQHLAQHSRLRSTQIDLRAGP